MRLIYPDLNALNRAADIRQTVLIVDREGRAHEADAYTHDETAGTITATPEGGTPAVYRLQDIRAVYIIHRRITPQPDPRPAHHQEPTA